ncbi:MAG: 30S ribosomal protein S6 [Gemmatimonadetes bacterium RBG_16_66_8]|nr:MAG: 30S ribosomal protein S6 [Gemmatimonadetes bacterium RBG_16_66_8]
MTRQYEVVYIFDSALEEAQVNERLQRFHSLLKNPEGEAIRSLDHWGKRTLAYPIKRREAGYYVVAKLETEPATLPEFERAVKLDEGVLRHLLVIDQGATVATAKADDDGGDVSRVEDLDE